MHGAGVAGGGVAEGILRGDRERLRAPAVVGDGKPVHDQVAGGGRGDGDARLRAGDAAVTVSVAVSDCVPAVSSVALKVCTPLSPAVKV